MVNHRLIQLMWNLSEQLIIWPSSVSESYRWAILEESWTICETWLGSWYYLVLPIVTRTLAEHKIREEAVRKDKKKATVCGPWMQKHSLLGGVFLLPLHCTCCHFHSRQRRWNWFTVTCASQMERLISLKLNWLGVTLWQLSVPFNFFFFLSSVYHYWRIQNGNENTFQFCFGKNSLIYLPTGMCTWVSWKRKH